MLSGDNDSRTVPRPDISPMFFSRYFLPGRGTICLGTVSQGTVIGEISVGEMSVGEMSRYH